MSEYLGLIELMVTVVGFTLFYIWQMRSLKRDVAEREKREADQKTKADGSRKA